jgi:hypothetical protein
MGSYGARGRRTYKHWKKARRRPAECKLYFVRTDLIILKCLFYYVLLHNLYKLKAYSPPVRILIYEITGPFSITFGIKPYTKM